MNTRVLFVLILFFSINVHSQEPNSIYNGDYMIGLGKGEYMEDEESLEIGLKDETGRESVMLSKELLDYVNTLRDKDSLVYHFLRVAGEDEISPMISGLYNLNIDRRFEVIFHPNTDRVMYVREMVLNENQAWDYTYENIFDKEGVERLFIRHHCTFQSDCAELAFERSEYFFDKNNELIKKTYSIFDDEKKPLENFDCWMDREEYTKYNNFEELNTKLNLPLDEISY